MRELGVRNFKIELIEARLVQNNDEHRLLEQEHINQIKPLYNMRRAFQTEEERKEQCHDKYLRKKERDKTMNFTCILCGDNFSCKSSLVRHLKRTSRHPLLAYELAEYIISSAHEDI